MVILLPSFLVLLFCPAPVLAFQSHTGPEGLYVHQMAHLFFAFAMGLLIYWLRKRKLVVARGWRYIQYAALFFIIWNVDAFAGHWLEELSGLIEVQRIGLMRIDVSTPPGYGWIAPLYYLTKLDHLLCVPALFFLYAGLRQLLNAPEPSVGKEPA